MNQTAKCKVVPLRFDSVIASEYDAQINRIIDLYGSEATFLPTVRIGEPIPMETEAIVFPVLVGEAYRQLDLIKQMKLPIIIITSPYGTMAMWDWEILTALRDEGLTVFAPYHPDLARVFFRTLTLKREMKTSRFIIWQNTPGDGMQADIFKRFFWWEKECTQRIKDKFGIEIVYRNLRDLGERAKAISDQRAWQSVQEHKIPTDESMTHHHLLKAYKLYLAICDELDQENGVVGVGTNCLNESFLCDTTPCLAWNLLYRERGLLWSCEGDTLSLLTQYIIGRTMTMRCWFTADTLASFQSRWQLNGP